MTTKTELRAGLRQRRAAFVAGRDRSFPLHPRLIKEIEAAQTIGSYCCVGAEPDVSNINHHVACLALPRVEGRGTAMDFRFWSPGDPLEVADFGFTQPCASAPLAVPDLVLVPLVGFDRNMRRLGQGAGHYDRYFERHPRSRKIGIAWSVQQVAALKADPWDVPLNAICTEKDWISGP